jgi:flagellar biosynthesis/type III secretory pathway protein FliH
MTSKNGDPVLVSMLQYMKKSDLNNPEIIVKDERIRKIDAVVTEVKESEEWEEVKMSILSYGIAQGREQGLAQGREQGLAQGREQGLEVGIRALIKDNLDTGTEEDQIIEKLVSLFSITPAQAKAYLSRFKYE